MSIVIKRIYDPVETGDGKRILVDRLWPRGVSKDHAMLDGWMKDVAPSPALRAWFGHRGGRFAEFAERYRTELDTQPEMQAAARKLAQMGTEGTVTLLYGARSPDMNQAAVLQQYLRAMQQP